MRYALLLLLIIGSWCQAQVIKPTEQKPEGDRPALNDKINKDSIFNRKRANTNDSARIFNPKISDYRYFTHEKLEKIPFDTALTIESFYNQNWIQKDWFGRMPFPNVGRPFNPLTYEKRADNLSILPQGKEGFYIPYQEVRYYDVKSPTSEFIYENGVRDGQALSTTFTHNPNRQINYSFRYRGLRSQGRFRREIASNNVLIFGLNYKTKNERLKIRSHYASHNVDNEESGGIDSLELFTEPGEEIVNTDNLEVNLLNTESRFDARRFHLSGSYGIFSRINPQDSSKYQPVRLQNSFTYEKQKYLYTEGSAETFFNNQSAVFSELARQARKSSEKLRNTTTLAFQWGDRLDMEAGILYENIKVYGDSALIRGLVNIPEGIEDNLIGATAKLNFNWNERIQLVAQGEYTRGDFFGNQYELNGDLTIQPLKDISVSGQVYIDSKFPALNLLYNQSFYQNFNYFNVNFKNQNTQKITGSLQSKKYQTTVQAGLSNIQNYVFVGSDLRPRQLSTDLSILEVKLVNHLQYRKYHFRTTALYQEVTQNADFLPLPQFVGRASLWWQTEAFNKAAEVQIGLNVNYFTGFTSRRFNPILNEFVLQDNNQETQEIGSFPMFDIFLNLKVKRMRIYLRADHINQLILDQRNYFSAPEVPYREWKLQIGLKWYLFT